MARSVYKLQELDQRYKLLRPGLKVLDLGCHPGSWLQYCAGKVGTNGLVVGVDIQPLALALPARVNFIQADLLAVNADELRQAAREYDIVISDVAPRTTGVAHADAMRSVELTGKALKLAQALLKAGGNFVAKVFWSAEAAELMQDMKISFTQAKTSKPAASASVSRETYLVGLGLK